MSLFSENVPIPDFAATVKDLARELDTARQIANSLFGVVVAIMANDHEWVGNELDALSNVPSHIRSSLLAAPIERDIKELEKRLEKLRAIASPEDVAVHAARHHFYGFR